MNVFVGYGDRKITLEIPEENLLFNVGPREAGIEPSEEEEITRALAYPIGSAELSRVVSMGQSVAIIVDDHTRLTPTWKILPHVLDELNRGGIRDDDIKVIIAGGTHRPMTKEEKRHKFGAETIERITFIDHDYLDREKLKDYGTTEYGTEVLVNTDAIEADFRMTIGVIFPHFPAGWGGGAKMLLPGIAGENTVAQFHLLGASHADTQLGQIDTVTRREMELFADKVGLHYIFNVVLDKHGHILKAFAGDYIGAHREGVAFARSIYEVDIPDMADLLISSTSPIDHDYFQVMKGLYSAEVCTKPGGVITLISPIYEGMAVTHREALQVTSLPLEDALAKIRNGDFEDNVGAAVATYQIKLSNNFDIMVVSEVLTPFEAEQLRVGLLTDPYQIQSWIDGLLKEDGDLKIGILHQSTEVLPRVVSP
ncbi:MAG: nickel-dependent lactate racemase [Anaerolineales bacterium]|nr:nickel-dependent lactate racemase [Anaerolineales bacterium]